MAAASVNAELLGRHFGSGKAVCYLLERDVARIVRRAVIGLGVDAEWREATSVDRAEALLVDIFGGGYQLIANFLCRFRARALRHDATDVRHLREPICILPQVLAHELVGGFAVAFAGHLHLEISGVELE